MKKYLIFKIPNPIYELVFFLKYNKIFWRLIEVEIPRGEGMRRTRLNDIYLIRHILTGKIVPHWWGDQFTQQSIYNSNKVEK